ncbi:AI-2E family transporter [Gracilimonas mengyeensis]|uniref:Predicted PurR-regulated permease PerM n=1 Tax=Gracilimonas mengyeensis TaxID=1302730 RepID=A0A521ETH7_9BACT|nr:AI-2E family transporter [Gracilimonas mengyeensis]SMO86390.1 Predicted PurR-regulated permease PerM [Gracilimonas mengyeensis]
MKNITLDRVVRFIIGLAAISVALLILYNYSNLVVFLVLAMILSYVLDPFANRLEAAGLNRTFGITLILATVILILVFISTSVIPIVAGQMAELTAQLSLENIREIVIRIENQLTNRFEFIPDGFLEENVTLAFNELFNINQISAVVSDALSIFTSIFSAVLVVPFAAFFFLKDGSKIRRDLLQMVPNKYFETTLTVIDKIEQRLSLYFRSVLLQSFLVALSSWATLSIAGLENSMSVGIAVGLANTIPYFGPVLGYILSIIVSIIETGNFSLVAACILAILIVQLLDNLIFQPMLFSRSADMHPVAILFIILVGAETAGILGMLIAIPIATVIKITITQLSWSFNNYQVFRRDVSQSGSPPG